MIYKSDGNSLQLLSQIIAKNQINEFWCKQFQKDQL